MIRMSMNCVPKDQIDNKTALDQVMALCETSEKPLPEPMMT